MPRVLAIIEMPEVECGESELSLISKVCVCVCLNIFIISPGSRVSLHELFLPLKMKRPYSVELSNLDFKANTVRITDSADRKLSQNDLIKILIVI